MLITTGTPNDQAVPLIKWNTYRVAMELALNAQNVKHASVQAYNFTSILRSSVTLCGDMHALRPATSRRVTLYEACHPWSWNQPRQVSGEAKGKRANTEIPERVVIGRKRENVR